MFELLRYIFISIILRRQEKIYQTYGKAKSTKNKKQTKSLDRKTRESINGQPWCVKVKQKTASIHTKVDYNEKKD